LVSWVIAQGSTSMPDAIRLSTMFWLAAHGGAVTTSVGAVTVHPLGITAALAYLLWRAGSWAGGASYLPTRWAILRLASTLTTVYVGLVIGVLVLGKTPAAQVEPVATAIGALVLAFVAGGLGVARGAGVLAPAFRRLPAAVGGSLRAGGAAVLVLISGSAALLAGSLVLHGGQVLTLTDALDAGPVGGFLLMLVSAALVPNGIAYALAYATGPGFALGAGSSVSVGGAHVGALPALPLLGAVPGGAGPSGLLYAVLAVPLLAGFGAGVVAIVHRRGASASFTALRALGAGPVAGLVALVVTWAASGGVGGGRLSALGPNPWQVALVTAAEVGVVGAAIAWAGCPRAPAAALVGLAPMPAATSPAPAASQPAAPTEPTEPGEPAAPSSGSAGDEETIVLPRGSAPPAA
jgi:hypothetical protein